MSLFNIAAAAAQFGVQSIIVKPKRQIGAFTAQVTLSEKHHDALQITDHPIERGSVISDHAFMLPAELTIEAGWSDSPAASQLESFSGIAAAQATISGVQSLVTGNSASSVRDLYQKMLQLQASRIPFDVYTGKRVYRNMLVRSLSTTSDDKNENSLHLVLDLREVILVSTSTVAVPAAPDNQADPKSTQSVTNAGSKALVPGSNFKPYALRGGG